MSFSDCCDYIESLPTVDHPELFGMQSNSNRFCLQNEAKILLDDLILVHPHVENVEGWVQWLLVNKMRVSFGI